MNYCIGPGSFGVPTTTACLTVGIGTRSLECCRTGSGGNMRRNWYTTTGLAIAIASLVLAGCGSADAEQGKVEKQKVEKVEKVEKGEKQKGKSQKVETRDLSDPKKVGSDF